jgi:hypothetical protein
VLVVTGEVNIVQVFILNFHTRLMLGVFLSALCVFSLAGCGNGTASATKNDIVLSKDINPCSYPKYWPYRVESSKYPFLVHYSQPDEQEAALLVVKYLDTAWHRQIDEQGYTAPPSDTGMCGPDGRFDVFIRRGNNSCKVDLVTDEFVTPWGGRASYMEVDPWGDYGKDILAATVAHEFNHATHAANDWYDLPAAFEMSASYVDQFYGPQDARGIEDFQKHSDWGLIRDDRYLTFYMYGSALYLHFLRDRYFGTNDSFVPTLWVNMRNKPDLTKNSPNFVDALNIALQPKGATFMDTVPEFARWRYYAGERNDFKHFRNLNDDTRKTSLATVPDKWQMALIREATLLINNIVTLPLSVPYRFFSAEPQNEKESVFIPAPMMTGSVYLTVKREDDAQSSFQLSFSGDPAVKWVVQAAPGLADGSDGDTVDISSGAARVFFTTKGERTLIMTALPKLETDFDPVNQTAIRYPITVNITP